ncbi:hypothetical protein [Mycobacterium sp. NAZ190054]|uniref:hypothetical protein n=1 Tax=Mycobacterium sp. NAZ190054 TaxID=1747766 RepID=UPI000A4D3855|nr:hypothetical protein [Mycobacterium sp. NAZ190054]
MSEQLPAELVSRCQAIADDSANQGEPLTRIDYLWFAVVTVAVPALLLLLGVML